MSIDDINQPYRVYTSEFTFQDCSSRSNHYINSGRVAKCYCLVEKVTGWSFYNLKDF